MPENPFLLVMIGRHRREAAATSNWRPRARATRSDIWSTPNAPSSISPQQWPHVRDGMRATALFVQGRVAAAREQYKEAEQSLLASLTLNPDDMEALYTHRRRANGRSGRRRCGARVRSRGADRWRNGRGCTRRRCARCTRAAPALPA